MDYRVAVDVGVLVWVMCSWQKPCRAFGRLDDDDAVGAVSLLKGVVMALSYLPHKSPGENLALASDERRRRYASCPPWGRHFGEVPLHRRLLMVSSVQKLSFLGVQQGLSLLGPLRSCGGRHTLRLFLRMKSELLAVGVRRRFVTMTCCSLFQRVGAGHVKEVALWWLG
uniref:Uncharacterized protein n=1 Tax=Oryza meridionalis TaxID=40149 RepID=A0A0E0DG83_9ORYZ